jgi:hypothetical protein
MPACHSNDRMTCLQPHLWRALLPCACVHDGEATSQCCAGHLDVIVAHSASSQYLPLRVLYPAGEGAPSSLYSTAASASSSPQPDWHEQLRDDALAACVNDQVRQDVASAFASSSFCTWREPQAQSCAYASLSRLWELGVLVVAIVVLSRLFKFCGFQDQLPEWFAPLTEIGVFFDTKDALHAVNALHRQQLKAADVFAVSRACASVQPHKPRTCTYHITSRPA